MSAPRFTSSVQAEHAFYRAFEQADPEAMMQVWADDDSIVCVHPGGGPALRGRVQVLESWLNIFARELDMCIALSELCITRSDTLAVHALHENISRRADPGVTGLVLATNVYRLTDAGWRMVLHHASPGPRRPPPLDLDPPGRVH